MGTRVFMSPFSSARGGGRESWAHTDLGGEQSSLGEGEDKRGDFRGSLSGWSTGLPRTEPLPPPWGCPSAPCCSCSSCARRVPPSGSAPSTCSASPAPKPPQPPSWTRWSRSAGPDSYTALGSPLLGARNYQERYVFVYRSGRTQVLDSYVYLDENPDRPDAFAREPFVVHFSLPSKVLPTLVLVPQHTVPKKAEAEIDALYDVFLDVQARWGTEDIMFLGDFNADCGYVAKKRWGQIQLRREPGFHWLIGDTADTTVRNSTRCAYDRR
ncbi:deoxyribonuclease-1-like 1 isoform X3 [Gopherus flavomarginatus]|uniref:deoxyribonuclease-1-like 1 isoform X3 n=1 Tax=Gopherus flavomarginatus TaxID=286002 RepID=UPI0021CBA866|nr:deoxyribonuclease-1-like 1 isoform X3 [Gopherus flavomarginatus]